MNWTEKKEVFLIISKGYLGDHLDFFHVWEKKWD